MQPAGEQVGVPTQFLWQGRVHVVRGVLAQWSQRVPWWRRGTTTPGVSGAVGGPGEEDAPAPTTVLEQQVWRVEATAGRAHGSVVYDLVSGERWLLERVSD